MSTATPYTGPAASSVPLRRVALDELRAHCAAILQGSGLPEGPADLVSDSLVDAEARGISSHGVTRVRIYSERLRAGMIDPRAVPELVANTPGRIRVDAHNAVGHLGAQAGLDAAIAGAKTDYVAIAGVANSNHCGTLGYFTRRATDAGLIAVGLSTAPPTMTYFGGRSRAVGTNPISIAVPRPDAPPIVVDMATSATARGKITLASKLRQDIPAGWAVDPDGRPTTDAAAALHGSVVPFGGAKGSGLAMMVDLLAGAMVAAVTGPDIGDMYEDYTRTQRVSHLFMALDPEGWVGRDAFLDHVDVFVRRFTHLPPADGVERLLLPGEPEQQRLARAQREGVLLAEAVTADLDAIADEVGIGRRVSIQPD
ncbi:Ldh family oxidoreductase [Rhizomonospora bruguierae]|uniref:Ldh family oxidoreductase n=1 Tax=Rhizomonospora bruguierae TaxID=1581705 RepID=UPI001BCC09B8|nr:Ldh family oxidoreductase [Micromonospora sp. NBRC 107566]